MKKDKYWFVSKKYGWGWIPKTWQAYSVICIYIAVIIYSFYLVDSNSQSVSDTLMLFIPALIFYSVILISICLIKGEKPRWRWGK